MVAHRSPCVFNILSRVVVAQVARPALRAHPFAVASRTMMLEELEGLLAYVGRPEAEKTEYLKAIDDENCLGKKTGSARKLTFRDLIQHYSLDPSITIFRAFLYFWQRDSNGHPLLALLCTYSRDPLLRSTANFIFKFHEGEIVSREVLEEYIDVKNPGRFSNGTLKSTAQNINSTWTKAGHLSGRNRKVRSKANPTPGSVAYALFLGYLNGARGEALFRTEFAQLLDCTFERVVELAEEASRRGWIVCKRMGNVIEVLFPNLINAQEMESLREQS